MEFQDVVRRRRMVRRFTGEPVSHQSLDRILANAVRGPSAGFSQGQAFLILTGPDLAEFWKVTGEPDSQTAENAPLIIVPLSCKGAYLDRYALPDKGWTDRDEARWPVPFWHIDTGMAALRVARIQRFRSAEQGRRCRRTFRSVLTECEVRPRRSAAEPAGEQACRSASGGRASARGRRATTRGARSR